MLSLALCASLGVTGTSSLKTEVIYLIPLSLSLARALKVKENNNYYYYYYYLILKWLRFCERRAARNYESVIRVFWEIKTRIFCSRNLSAKLSQQGAERSEGNAGFWLVGRVYVTMCDEYFPLKADAYWLLRNKQNQQVIVLSLLSVAALICVLELLFCGAHSLRTSADR